MNKDDFDIFHLKKDPEYSSSFDLMRGLENRKFGYLRKDVKTKENIEVFAEEQLVRKKTFEEMRCEMPGSPRSTFLMVFSPDGSKVASTHGNHNIYVTDIRTGKNIRTLIGHPRTPWCIAFHPSLDQIVASGCLGGQVRIWDLSGGSEVWTAGNQSVIASIAFHPNDRVLVIATYNEVYFWDWSQPEPFVHASTSNPKEKVRYVAFDKLGHKLITGIANSPQTRWERVRAPVPVPRQERCVSPYRRRITQRVVNMPSAQQAPASDNGTNNREPLSGILERERRITVCYRNLVREYEQLVERYLQLYRPPTMIDRGTDPMETNPCVNSSSTQTSEASTPSTSHMDSSVAGPSTSRTSPQNPVTLQSNNTPPRHHTPGADPTGNGPSANSSNLPPSSSQSLLTPSRILSAMKKTKVLLHATQSTESRKHKAKGNLLECSQEKRFKKNSDQYTQKGNGTSNSSDSLTGSQLMAENRNSLNSNCHADNSTNSSSQTQQHSDNSTQIQNPSIGANFNNSSEETSSNACSNQPSTSALQSVSKKTKPIDHPGRGSSHDEVHPSTSNFNNTTANTTGRRHSLGQNSVDELLSNIRRTAEEEVRSRILPIIRSVPANDRPELIRLFENSREQVRMRFRQMCPILLRTSNQVPVNLTETASESSSSDDYSTSSNNRLARSNSEPTCSTTNASANLNSTDRTVRNSTVGGGNLSISVNNNSNSTDNNFNIELEQLVTSLLMEIERNETENVASTTNSSTPCVGNSIPNVTATGSATSPSISLSRPSCSFQPSPSLSGVESNSSSNQNQQPPNLTGNILCQDFTHLQNLTTDRLGSSPSSVPTSVSSDTPATIVNINTRTTNSTIYTSGTSRRHFFSHRVSAFMPTRVNYTRSPTRPRRTNYHTWGRTRLGTRAYGSSPFALDELINYSERENSEDDPSQQQWNLYPFDAPEDLPTNSNNVNVRNMYSSIVQDLESGLNDVRNIRASNRPGETSNMLSTFSERLDNIMNQSDMILRNLTSCMQMLISTTEADMHRSQTVDPSWGFFDQNFYIRDQGSDSVNSEVNTDLINLSDLFNTRSSFNAVASDHTYPRNPDSGLSGLSSTHNNHLSPLMTTLHLTITHIQRQARLLRQQVESIERIDRAMLEVAQLQLIRQLIIELVRHIRSLSGENRSTGMTSVRQMMAGTRISDSGPYDSSTDESNSRNRQANTHGETSTSGEQSSNLGHVRPKTSNRKTYPPSRLFRLARQCRRPSLVHFFSRRYLARSERGQRQSSQSRPTSSRTTPQDIFNSLRNPSFSNYSIISSSTLSLMARRLEQLLTEQMRTFRRRQETPRSNRSSATVDLGEHILGLRLHGCVLRMTRVLGLQARAFRELRNDSTSAVTQDGVSRYGARHTLSLIVDGMSRHVEELSGSNISQTVRVQIHGVLVMSLLLTELLLLVVVDSIPPPSGLNLDPERDSLATRIDQMCAQMLQSRFGRHSNQLTRSLRLMRQTMRHAYRALGQTYTARRNAIQPRPDTDRRQLLGSISRCLLTINRRMSPRNLNQEASNESNENTQGRGPELATSDAAPEGSEWCTAVSDLITQYWTANDEEHTTNNRPSTTARQREPLSSNNDDNSDDDDDDEPERYENNNSISHNSNLYRTNSATSAQNAGSASQPRPWNVPSVQVNDVPVTEPSSFAQRLISQRQRFAERVSELRSNPALGLFRPRFLHPLSASFNSFDADLDDPQREQVYDSDMIATVTPNHRIQAWDISNWNIPIISNSLENIVVNECKIHNDASVDIANDGSILVTLLPSVGYMNATTRLGIYSLRWESLGQCLYTTNFEENAVSVSLSPLSRHLVVGLASRRVPIVPTDRWVMARIFKVDQKDGANDRLPVLRELEQNRDSRINCIRWLPSSGQGLIYATNTGQLVIIS